MRAPRPVRGPAPAGHGSSVDDWASGRRAYLDNLKVLLIAAIIAVHAVLSYAGTLDVWPYTEVREVTLSPVVETALFVVVGPIGFFLIPLLFLVAGLLTPASLDRKGPRGFVRDRLLRLGVPFAVYVLLVQPTLVYALEHPLGVAPGSYWEEFLGQPPQLDMGPLWFVAVLLVFSLGYAGWVAVVPDRPERHGSGEIRAMHLWLVAIAVAPATFLIRVTFQIGGEAGLQGLNFWEWPACIAAFALGVNGVRQGWLAGVPDRLRRQCRTTTLLAAVALGAFMLLLAALGVDEDLRGGWQWRALGFAAIESTLVVFGSVWLLAASQRHLDRRLRGVGPFAHRSAYGAFMVQTPVLIGLAVALRPLSLPAELKALALVGGGVAGSYALAWLLISRVPGVRRIL
jgi:hypothetical protein